MGLFQMIEESGCDRYLKWWGILQTGLGDPYACICWLLNLSPNTIEVLIASVWLEKLAKHIGLAFLGVVGG